MSASTPVEASSVGAAPAPSVVEHGVSVQQAAIDLYFNEVERAERTLQDLHMAKADESFAVELSAIEEWFKVLGDNERTAALYSLLQYLRPNQIRFFITILNTMTRSGASASMMAALGTGASPMRAFLNNGAQQSAGNGVQRVEHVGTTAIGPSFLASPITPMSSGTAVQKPMNLPAPPAFHNYGGSSARGFASPQSVGGKPIPWMYPVGNNTIANSAPSPYSATSNSGYSESSSLSSGIVGTVSADAAFDGQAPRSISDSMLPSAHSENGVPAVVLSSQYPAGGRSPTRLAKALDNVRKDRANNMDAGSGFVRLQGSHTTPKAGTQQQNYDQVVIRQHPGDSALIRISKPAQLKSFSSEPSKKSSYLNREGTPSYSYSTGKRYGDQQPSSASMVSTLRRANSPTPAPPASASLPNQPNSGGRDAIIIRGPRGFGARLSGVINAGDGSNTTLSSGLDTIGGANGTPGFSKHGQQHGTPGHSYQGPALHTPMSAGRYVTGRYAANGGLGSAPRSAHFFSPTRGRGVYSPRPMTPEWPRANERIDFNILESIPMWLRSMRLHKYTQLFESLGMHWTQIIEMNDEELAKVGVSTLGARTKFLKVFAQIKTELNAGNPPAISAEATNRLVQTPSTAATAPESASSVLSAEEGELTTPTGTAPPAAEE